MENFLICILQQKIFDEIGATDKFTIKVGDFNSPQ